MALMKRTGLHLLPSVLYPLWIVAIMLFRTVLCEQFTTHPMLFYSPKDVPKLREQAKTTHSKIAGVIADAAQNMLGNQQHFLPPTDYAKFGSHWNEVYGNNLATLAMYCVLYPNDKDAKNFAFKYMDNMAALPKWQVISLPKDEVPVAHSLTGFVTAFDFLYPVFGKERRMLYFDKIVTATQEMYELSKIRSWGSQYLQNHVATNYLSLLHGSLVVSVHRKELAETWITHTRAKFNKTMFLLNHITDGSLDEGVAYGTYTSRSVTQYAYLVQRHFGVDHTQGLWFKEHFWFYYSTVMPRFHRAVGIGDSNGAWFYGPESQLVFLDNFVMRNGHGNWLAQEIRSHRETDRKFRWTASESQRWCTLHTEFLWYNSSIPPKPPPQTGSHQLHVFSDWGVVTYSRVSPSHPADTFLTFKSGKLHGRGIFDIVQRNMFSSWIKKWRSFNPGHEHPDQNMFTFSPNGQQFVTDGLYGPKYTYLNNVLLFSPSPTSQCFQPWEGQLGECKKWLLWRNPEVARYGADLITASSSNGMVHVSGEARDSYHPKMGLLSVYRSLVLLNPNLLVILDHIQKQRRSPLTHVAAFFNNIVTPFEEDKLGKMYGVKANLQGEDYRMLWVTAEGRSPRATIVKEGHFSEFIDRKTNFVNVTLKLRPTLTRMAYILYGPSENVIDMHFTETKENGVSFEIQTENLKYRVDTVTKHNDPLARQYFLGYPGYVSVRTGSTVTKFGVNSISLSARRKSDPKSDKLTRTSMFLGLVMVALVLMYLANWRFRRLVPTYRNLMLGTVLITSFSLWTMYSSSFCKDGSCSSTASVTNHPFDTGLPSVVITSLPGSGSEILGWLFYYNPDFLLLQVPSNILKFPEATNSGINPFVDACLWTKKDASDFSFLATKIKNLRWNRYDLLGTETHKGRSVKHVMMNRQESNQFVEQIEDSKSRKALFEKKHVSRSQDQEIEYKVYDSSEFFKHASKFPNSQSILHFTSGSWGLKLQWLQAVLGDSMRSIHIVRDPRAWIANFLRNNLRLYNSMSVSKHIQVLALQLQTPCQLEDLDSASYYKLQDAPHKLLATLWSSYIDRVLSTVGPQYRVVMYEDLVRSPRGMADIIYKFIGFPLPPSMEQQFIQAAHTGIFESPHEGVVQPALLDRWKTELTLPQIQDIESICARGMRRLGYSEAKIKNS